MLRRLAEALPTADLPGGARLRPVTPEHYQAIRLAANEAFQDSWSDVPADEEQFKAWLEAPDFRPELWLVARDGDEIAGMALNAIHTAENREYNRGRGWMYSVCTRRPWPARCWPRACAATLPRAWLRSRSRWTPRT